MSNPTSPHCRIFNEKASSGEEYVYYTVQFNPEILTEGLAYFNEWKQAAKRLMSITHGVKIVGVSAMQIGDLMKRMNQVQGIDRLVLFMRIIQVLSSGSHDFSLIGLPGTVNYDITPSMKKFHEVVEYIAENYKERITLSDISQVANMTETAFCAFFKQKAGMTFISYINKYRIEVACTMLRNQLDKTIGEIAWECGFSDIPHFNRNFKKEKGVNPTQWREQM